MRTGRIIAAFLLLAAILVSAAPAPFAAEKTLGDVVVLKKRLPRHALLNPEDVEISRRELGGLGSDPIASLEDAEGKRLRVSAQEGAVLTRAMLDEPPLVRRGEIVTIVAENRDFRLTTLGEARADGTMNEVVRVKNLTSRREILARVVADGTVAVEL